MHRQLSLSPGPKQQQHDDGGNIGIGSDAAEVMAVPEESSAAKGRSVREERTIHLIPLLTFLCFLLLFSSPTTLPPLVRSDSFCTALH